MKKVLIFKTASDTVMNGLLSTMEDAVCDKYCLIQSSLLSRFKIKYPNFKFIDIQQEGFYDIQQEIIDNIKQIYFNTIYIPVSSVRAINFSNIIEIIGKLNYEQIVFYNCNGEEKVIKKMSKLQEWIIKQYIYIVSKIYVRG